MAHQPFLQTRSNAIAADERGGQEREPGCEGVRLFGASLTGRDSPDQALFVMSWCHLFTTSLRW